MHTINTIHNIIFLPIILHPLITITILIFTRTIILVKPITLRIILIIFPPSHHHITPTPIVVIRLLIILIILSIVLPRQSPPHSPSTCPVPSHLILVIV